VIVIPPLGVWAKGPDNIPTIRQGPNASDRDNVGSWEMATDGPLVRRISFSGSHIYEHATATAMDVPGKTNTRAAMGILAMSSGSSQLNANNNHTSVARQNNAFWRRSLAALSAYPTTLTSNTAQSNTNWDIAHFEDAGDMRLITLRTNNSNRLWLYIEVDEEAAAIEKYLSVPIAYTPGTRAGAKVVCTLREGRGFVGPLAADFVLGNEFGFVDDGTFNPGPNVKAAPVTAYVPPSLPANSKWEGVTDIASGDIFKENFRRGMNLSNLEAPSPRGHLTACCHACSRRYTRRASTTSACLSTGSAISTTGMWTRRATGY